MNFSIGPTIVCSTIGDISEARDGAMVRKPAKDKSKKTGIVRALAASASNLILTERMHRAMPVQPG